MRIDLVSRDMALRVAVLLSQCFVAFWTAPALVWRLHFLSGHIVFKINMLLVILIPMSR